MDERKTTGREENTLPAEVVETYRQPRWNEVVETYSRPLPRRMAPQSPVEQEAPLRPRKKRKGLWIFLACLLVIAVAAGGAWLWNRSQADRWDPFEYHYGDPSDQELRDITIPAYP